MPFINVQTIKGLLDEKQKSELLERITDLFIEVEGRGDPAFKHHVWVRIDEHDPEQWSLGGFRPTKEIIKMITEK